MTNTTAMDGSIIPLWDDLFMAAAFGHVHQIKHANLRNVMSANRKGWIPVMYASALGQHGALVQLLSIMVQEPSSSVATVSVEFGVIAAGTGATGAIVGATGAIVGSTGSIVGATGAIVGATGAIVGSTGAIVGATGTIVGATGAVATAVGVDDVESVEMSREVAAMKAMTVAIYFGRLDTVAFLLDTHTLTVETRDGQGWTPLLHASAYDQPTIAAALLRRGADVNSTDVAGNTALMLAASAGFDQVARILLASGAEKSIVNKEKKQAWELAHTSGFHGMVVCLKPCDKSAVRGLQDVAEAVRGLGVENFCYVLALSLDFISPLECAWCFLLATDLSHYWPIFQLEEVDFGVLLTMTNQDLLDIGVRDNLDRRRMIVEKEKSQLCLDNIFGYSVSSKLFKIA